MKHKNRNMFKGLFILGKILKYNVYYPKRYLRKSTSVYQQKHYGMTLLFKYVYTQTHTHRLKSKTGKVCTKG